MLEIRVPVNKRSGDRRKIKLPVRKDKRKTKWQD
jgi:hypothetical protein